MTAAGRRTGCRLGFFRGEGLFCAMDMKHDFTSGPDLDRGKGRNRHPAFPDLKPELIAIVGIFVVVWIVFGLHFLAGGLS
ncbi:hypothetical protein [Novosphingobium sp. AP12]|uniref:hypothetical protein n=1 Tax=Novosphingobium sp. AP12 TaxID=1144305 RepID=UPI000272153D|nr:hypothetical protein [Novosphingobium sp. AP12]EJL23789.1 hypothetical protein PMI02_04023 [Novosphingobium sp. AP12]